MIGIVDIPRLAGQAASGLPLPRPPECHAGYSKVSDMAQGQRIVSNATAVHPPNADSVSKAVLPSRYSVSQITEWRPSDQKRFQSLAAKFALNKISKRDTEELSLLIERRRAKVNPRKGEALIVEFKQSERHAALVAAIQDYASFFGTTR